jgi:hypothetical protein
MKRRGAFLIALGAGLGLAVSIYNYFSPIGFLSPVSDTAGTPGALLVIGSTAIMLVAGLVLATEPRSRLLTWFAVIGCLIDIIGTGFAAMLLDSTPLLVCMAISAVGWLLWIFGPRPAPATA